MKKESREVQFHIQCRQGDVGRYCLLPGDPGRCELIASFFENPVHIGQNREYNIYTGTLLGEKVTVCSTGIGGPSAVHRHGGAVHHRRGYLHPGGHLRRHRPGRAAPTTWWWPPGPSATSRPAGSMRPLSTPPCRTIDVLTALVEAAKALGKPWHAGVVQCKDAFYGQHDPARMPVSYELQDKWEAWKRLGVKASEMESAALFVVADALGVPLRLGFHVIWNQEREKAGLPQEESEDVTLSVKLGIEAVKRLILADRAKEGK